MSYYEKSKAAGFAFDCEKSAQYDNNYHYDGVPVYSYFSLGLDDILMANIFKSSACPDGEELKAVSNFFANTNTDYTVSIYTDLTNPNNPKSGTLVSSQSGTTTYEGYYTIDLNKTVMLEPDETFSVVFEVKKSGNVVNIPVEVSYTSDDENGVASIKTGQSFYSAPGYGWYDIANDSNLADCGNLHIKAFTVNRSDANTKEPTSIAFADNLSRDGLDLGVGETYIVNTTILPDDANKSLIWSSSNTSVATVSTKGYVKGVGTGSATITATAERGGLSASFNVSVSKKIISISIDGPSDITYNATTKYSIVTNPVGMDVTGRVVWSSSDPSVISIDSEGNATAHKISSATLRATVDGKSAELTVNVMSRYAVIKKYRQKLSGGMELIWDGIEEADKYVIYTGLNTSNLTKVAEIIEDGSDKYSYVDTTYVGSAKSGIYYRISTVSTNPSTGITSTMNVTYNGFSVIYPTKYYLGYIGGTRSIANKTLNYNETTVIESSGDAGGRKFVGWNTEEDGSGESYVAGQSVKNLAEYNYDSVYLYAQWENQKYKITFNPMGGSCDTAEKQYEYSKAVGTLPTPTKPGYTFDGWYTGTNGNGSKITSTTTMYFTTDLTLYANWKGKSVTVSYDANGGTVSPTSKSVTVGSTYGTLPNPTRTGYTFDAWYTEALGGSKITSSSTVTADSDHTIFAHWTPKSYYVYFDGNGGSVPKTSMSVTYDSTYGTLPVPTRTGYTFAGWYTDKTSGTEIKATDTVNITSSQTIYAHWDANEYTVTFDATGGSTSQTTKTVTYGQKYGTLPTPTKGGYDFTGWYTSASGGTLITKDSTVNITSAQTLYAHWSGKSITVTYDANGGSVSQVSKSVTVGATYGSLPTPTRSGYTFDGWYTDRTSGTKITSSSTVDATSNHTIYAHWIACTYTVSFDTNCETASPASITVTYGGTYGELPKPTREGYSFIGWFTDKTSGTEITKDSAVDITSNVTLYAHWDGLTYRVDFDANGSGATCTPTSKDVKNGEAYGTLPTPTRTGYTFAGWFTDATSGTEVSASTIVNLTSGVTLYAHWRGKKVTVSFDANANEYVAVSPRNKDVYFGDSYGVLPTISRTGYDFAGWFTDATSGDEITSSSTVVIESNHTVYAHWTAKSYEVSFNAAPGSVSETSRTVTYGKTYGANGDLPIPVRTGYDFTGWYTSVSGGTQITKDSLVNITSSLALYAHWSAKSIVVSLNANGGECNIASITVKYDGRYANLPELTRDGFNFEGWFTDAENGDRIENGMIVSVTTDITLYAHWEERTYPDGLTITGIPTSIDYTGKAITFDTLKVLNEDTELKLGVDYTIKYTNNVKAAKAGSKTSPTVTVTGKGNYAGTVSQQFTINQRDFTANDGECILAPDITVAYAGKPITKITNQLMYKYPDGSYVNLREKTDYMYDSAYSIDGMGEYDVTVIGCGNYTGNVTFKVNVVDSKSLADSKILLNSLKYEKIADKSATGEAVLLSTGDIITKDGKTLELYVEDGADNNAATADVKVTYCNNILPGTATVVLEGMNEYVGTTVLTYRIVALPMNKALVMISAPEKPYTGDAIELVYNDNPLESEFRVDYAEKNKPLVLLKKGVDYEVSYLDNVLAGKKATLVITGMGKYSGTVKKSFTIGKAAIDSADISFTGYSENIPAVKYVKSKTEPELTVIFNEKTLVKNVDYSLKYYNNKMLGSAYVTITGKGNFNYSAIKYFDITYGNMTATANDVLYNGKPGNYKTTINVYDTKGNKLSAGTDYDKDILVKRCDDPDYFNVSETVTATEAVPVGTMLMAEIRGINNFAGNKIYVPYRVAGVDIAKATVKIADYQYTGRAITPGVGDMLITLKVGSSNVVLDENDVEIVGYENNVKKGTAKVTLHGIYSDEKGYGGYKTVTFKILSKSMNYTIYYDRNNSAASGTMKPSSITAGGKLAANKYVCPNKTFDYWSTSPEYNTAEDDALRGIIHYSDKDTFIGSHSTLWGMVYGKNITLYAHWK